FSKNPNERIHSYSGWSKLKNIPFRPEDTQDSIMRSLEDIIEGQIRGDHHISAVNYSFGFANAALNDKQFRTEFADLSGAYQELASKLGIRHSVSAGNAHGASPVRARYGDIGEINSLGLRIDEDGKVTQQDGLFFAGAQDTYMGSRLAEFTSKGDPL